MVGFSALDLAAIAWFAIAWIGYSWIVELSVRGRTSLNNRMDRHRHIWMSRMLARDVRIVDTQIMASLQNGTAFFATTSLFAIGGALSLMQSTEEVLKVVAALPLGIEMTRAVWEIKAIGLLVLFVYAFFKFSWSYRLFNYAAILMGATPEKSQVSESRQQEAQAAADRVARMSTLAGRHFNRGQRAFFFALAYLGWFVNAWVFALATAAVLVVIIVRQFGPAARNVLGDETI